MVICCDGQVCVLWPGLRGQLQQLRPAPHPGGPPAVRPQLAPAQQVPHPPDRGPPGQARQQPAPPRTGGGCPRQVRAAGGRRAGRGQPQAGQGPGHPHQQAARQQTRVYCAEKQHLFLISPCITAGREM